MRYVDIQSVNPIANDISTHVMRANSIFAPDVVAAGSAHQPLTRDQWFLSYSQYRVIRTTIKVTPLPVGIANVVPCAYGIAIRPTTSLDYPDSQAIIEDPRQVSSYGLTGVLGFQHPLSNKIVSRTFNVNMMDKEQQNDSHDMGVNPVNNSSSAKYFHIWFDSLGGNDPGTVTFNIEMEFTVELSDPKELGQS